MKYLLGSGYFEGENRWAAQDFSLMWAANVGRFTKPDPQITVILTVGNSWYPNQSAFAMQAPVRVIDFQGNLGHVHHLIHKLKPHEFGGWSASILALAMMAYTAELDFVYREQDVLAFGPYIEKMYSEIGDAKMIFGSYDLMPCAQSLFLIKHEFIPKFVESYISLGGDRDVNNLPEHKFSTLQSADPKLYRRFGFGYDRGRPINFDDPVWYAQRLTPEEIDTIKGKGLL